MEATWNNHVNNTTNVINPLRKRKALVLHTRSHDANMKSNVQATLAGANHVEKLEKKEFLICLFVQDAEPATFDVKAWKCKSATYR